MKSKELKIFKTGEWMKELSAGHKVVLYLLVPLLFIGLIGFVVWFIATNDERKKAYKESVQSFESCGEVEHKYATKGQGFRVAEQSKPVVVFLVDGKQCNYSPDYKEFSRFRTEEHYLVKGNNSSRGCDIYEVLGVCPLIPANENPELT